VTTPWPANDVVPFTYFSPDRAHVPAPAVVVLHGLGLTKDTFAPAGPHLRRQGYAALLLDLPFHGDRAVTDGDRLFPFRGDLSLYVTGIRQALSDVVLCLTWLRRRREIDPRRIAVVGFSFGGVLCSLLMGLGLDLAAGVSLMAAGDWADLIFQSSLAADVRTDLERSGVTPEAAVEAFRGITASAYASFVRDLLIIGGRRDQTVPPRILESFWRKLDPGANRLLWADCGHVPPIRSTAREVFRFLREKLRPTAANGKDLIPHDARLESIHFAGAGPALPSILQIPVSF